jgi:hypothetical protein
LYETTMRLCRKIVKNYLHPNVHPCTFGVRLRGKRIKEFIAIS